VQELGGAVVGSGLMAGYQGLAQGRTTKRATGNLERLGLIGDPSKVKTDKMGQAAFLNPGALKGYDLFANNQFRWMQEVLLPTLAKQGITGDKQVLEAIGSIYSNPRGGNLMAQMYLQRDQINRAALRNATADGIDQVHDKAMNTPGGREQQLAARRDDLYKRMGDAALPTYVRLLEVLTKVVEKVADFSERHPTLVKWLVIGAAAVAGLSVALGAVLIPLGLFMMNGLMMRVVFGMAGSSLFRMGGTLKWLGGGAKWLGGALQQVLALAARFGPRLLALSGGALRLGGALMLIPTAIYMWWKNWDGIKGGLKVVWDDLGNTNMLSIGVKLALSLVSGLLEFFGLGGAAQWVNDLGDRIINGMATLKTAMMKAGADLVAWLIEGVTSQYAALRDKVSKMAGDTVDWFKGKLGIQSPSRVFMAFGGHISEGLALGIERSQQLASRAALALAASAAVAASPGMAAGITPTAAGLARPQASAPRTLGGGTYNITINATPDMDPQAIARAVRLELDRREREQRGRVLSQLSDME
jgi:hypothetical protein